MDIFGTLLLYLGCCKLLKRKDIKNLENIQRKCLRQIQGLSDNTSNSAWLALLGILPIESVLHKTLLNLFVNMIRDPNAIQYEIAQRQLVMRDLPQKRMFTHISMVCHQY